MICIQLQVLLLPLVWGCTFVQDRIDINQTPQEMSWDSQSRLEQQIQCDVQQTLSNFTFLYRPIIDDEGYYLIYEVFIQDTSVPRALPTMMLYYKNGQPGYVDRKVDVLKSDGKDINGYLQSKDYLHLSIPPADFGVDDLLYFSLIIPENTIYRYSILLSRQQSQTCPRDCSQQGECVNGLCQCLKGFIDEDCSVSAKQLNLGNKQSIKLSSSLPEFFYYQPPVGSTDTVEIGFNLLEKVSLDQGITIYLKAESSPVWLPVDKANDNEFKMGGKNDTYKQIIFPAQLRYFPQYNRTQRMIYSAKLTKYLKQTVTLNIDPELQSGDSEDNTNLLLVYFLVAVAVVLLLTWIILTLIKIKYQRQNRIQTENQTQNQNRRRRRQQSTQVFQFSLQQALKPETIEEFMPKLGYHEIFQTRLKHKKEKMPGESCSVCLLEFEDEDTCRVTPCDHVFHSDCLEQWLKKHENCPICRTDLGEKELRNPLKPLEEQQLINNDVHQLIIINKENNVSPHQNTNMMLSTVNARQANQLRVLQGRPERQENEDRVENIEI